MTNNRDPLDRSIFLNPLHSVILNSANRIFFSYIAGTLMMGAPSRV